VTKRKTCSTHTWRTMRSGVETCETCGTRYPCRALCSHVDCADRRVELARARAADRKSDTDRNGDTKITQQSFKLNS